MINALIVPAAADSTVVTAACPAMNPLFEPADVGRSNAEPGLKPIQPNINIIVPII